MTEGFLSLKSAHVRWLIILTFIIGLVFDSMVLLNSDLGFIPPMALLAVFYWSCKASDTTYIVSAFILGLLADALHQTTLGAHALLYIIMLFAMLRHRLQFRTYPEWQQAFIIGVYLMVYQILNYLFFSPVLSGGSYIAYWTMPAAGILIWPFLTMTLNLLTSRQSR